MAISTIALLKSKIGNLRNVPRDIFFTLENSAPAVGAVVRINLDTLGGVGLDLDISNAAAAAGPATVTIDKVKVITLAPGTRFTLENVLYSLIEFQRAGAAAVLVSAYYAGISNEAMEQCR